jgi:hypothetical protein
LVGGRGKLGMARYGPKKFWNPVYYREFDCYGWLDIRMESRIPNEKRIIE